LWNKFLGVADLGTDDMWKTWPQLYETDNDNYIDLCLQLTEADNDGKDIVSVNILQNVVFPPRGTGPNISHQVRVEHIEKGGNYPYNLEGHVTPAEIINDIHVRETLEIVTLVGSAGTGIVVIPILGLLMGTGMMFL
jgi:hypothetical protein